MVVDPEKASVYKRYLVKAVKRLKDRDVARQRLEEQILELRKLGGEDVKRQLAELERRIAEAIEREQHIVGFKQTEDLFHRKLRDRIDLLERKITGYLGSREERLKRITELEEKIALRLSDKNEQLSALKVELGQLESFAQELEGEPKLAKRLRGLQQRMEAVKNEIAARAA